MKGSVYKRCTRCPKRATYGEGDRRCPACGATSFVWYFQVDIGRGPTGKRKRRTKGGFQNKRDAERAMRDVVADVDRGRVIEPNRLTVRAFLCDQWLPSMKLTIEPTTWDGYREKIHSYVLERIGDLPLQDLKPPKLNWLYADVRENGRVRGDAPLSLKTVREVHVVMHRALNDAVRWDYLPSNPADRANAPSATAAKNERKKAITTWTAEQVHAFAEQFVDHPLYPIWLLASSTGMRRSELLGLRWAAVELDRGRLAVRQVLVLVAGRPHFKEAPKSAHGFRTISIPPLVVDVLRATRHRQSEQRLRSPIWNDHDLVFTRDDGDPWHPDHVTSTIREAILASELPRIRPLQDLRHTHATLLLADGENPKVVQERLGHHSHAFTADTYQHVMPGMDEAAASRFEDLVFGPTDRRQRRGR